MSVYRALAFEPCTNCHGRGWTLEVPAGCDSALKFECFCSNKHAARLREDNLVTRDDTCDCSVCRPMLVPLSLNSHPLPGGCGQWVKPHPPLNDPRFDAWAEAHGRARAEQIAESWFVIGHSGREGDPWKVFFESGDEAEARAFFWKRSIGDGRYAKSYKSTSLVFGSPFLEEQRLNTGLPFVRGTDTWDRSSESRAKEARELREERRKKQEARRAKVRVEEEQLAPVRLRFADVGAGEDMEAERELRAVEEAEARQGEAVGQSTRRLRFGDGEGQ
jgi:hypothetical protein